MEQITKTVNYAVRKRSCYTVIPKEIKDALGLADKGVIRWTLNKDGSIKIEKMES